MDHEANKWTEDEGDNIPFPSEKCPKCDGLGWGFQSDTWDDYYQFYCPECGYNLVDDFGSQGAYALGDNRYENYYTFPQILKRILDNYSPVDYPVLPLISQPKTPIISKFGNLWEEENNPGQAFWPLDQNWMDKNRSQWTYFCPECGKSESVYIGPSEENSWQIPEWENDEFLVEKIRDVHAENPGQDIDYCNNCNAVWLRPDIDYTMIKDSAADPDWWAEFVAETPYMLHFFRDEKGLGGPTTEGIEGDGLIPYMAPLQNAPESNWAETDLESRPGHVYLMHPAFYQRVNEWDQNYNAVAIVDASMLDPSRVNPDEDWFRNDFSIEPPYDSVEEGYPTGLWAERVDLRDPDRVKDSIDQGSIAYKGGIPPEAILDIVGNSELQILMNKIKNPSVKEYGFFEHLEPYAPGLEQAITNGRQAGTYEDAKALLGNGGGWKGIPPAPRSMADRYRSRSTDSWKRGEWGKGAIVPQEDAETGMIVEVPMTWNVTKEGTPHHNDVGGGYYEYPIWISPDGVFTSASWINTEGAPDIEEHYMHEKSFEPFVELGLTYMKPWDWVMEYWGPQGTSYGHGQNVLDILNKQAFYV